MSTDGQTDMMKIIVAFRNFENACKMSLLNAFSWFFSVTVHDRRDIAFEYTPEPFIKESLFIF